MNFVTNPMEIMVSINCCQLMNIGHKNTFLLPFEYFQWLWLRVCDGGLSIPKTVYMFLLKVWYVLMKEDIAKVFDSETVSF